MDYTIKLSRNLYKKEQKDFSNVKYIYKFELNQHLDEIDDYSHFGISHNNFKEGVVNFIVNEFRR